MPEPKPKTINISTLTFGALLAGAVSAGAQTVGKDTIRKDAVRTVSKEKTLRETQEVKLKENLKPVYTEQKKHRCERCGRG